jgi:lipoate-protein ligase A
VSDWLVERIRGTAADLHAGSARLVAAEVARTVRVLDAVGPAVVLGRAEPGDHVDAGRAAAAGVEVCRRESGGSAVLVGRRHAVWVDLAIPVGDPLWSADVGRAMWWVGDLWRASLDAMGRNAVSVWRGPMRRGPWSDRVCFGGVGPGEVVVAGPGPEPVKVVGISQRRTRHGALFQCSVPVVWDPAALLDVLTLTPTDRRAAVADLRGAAVGLGPDAELGVELLLERLGAAPDRSAAPGAGQLP